MPPHLKKSINKAHLQNGIYEQIVSYIERELGLDGLQAPVELQIKTVTQKATQQNPEKPKPAFQHSKKPSHYGKQCHQLKRERNQAQNNPNSADNNKNNIIA